MRVDLKNYLSFPDCHEKTKTKPLSIDLESAWTTLVVFILVKPHTLSDG